jgi:hypothetical protein
MLYNTLPLSACDRMAHRAAFPLSIDTDGLMDGEKHLQLQAQGALHHNRDLTLQKYILLQEQHEDLRTHLEELLSPLSTISVDSYYTEQHLGRNSSIYPTTVISSPGGSPHRSGLSASSQTSPYASRSPSANRTRQHRRSMPPGAISIHPAGGAATACALETLLDESTLTQVAAEEAQLFDVNEGIKRTLTELLNCETVRGDRAFRTWVQSRLMDAEKELRMGRRRRSAVGDAA